MGLKFSAKSLDECIEKASSELDISKEYLDYKIIKEERRLFKKIVEIEIIEDTIQNQIKSENTEIQTEISQQPLSSGAKIENGIITVTNCDNSNEIITIKSCPGVRLFVNGQYCDNVTPITQDDTIEYEFEETDANRNSDITITKDNMEVYITITYSTQNIYQLVDQNYCKNLILKKKVISQKYQPHYTVNELIDILKKKNVRYGIITEELEKISGEYNVKNRLIAKGRSVKDDTPDEIKLLFKDSNELINYESEQKIDYRNRYAISIVKNGEVIAEKILGKQGEDGIDIFGKTIKRKTAKSIFIKAGEGCIVKENKVIATSDGKPTLKGTVFIVNKLYRVEDVNLESGNINFVGDVDVEGTVNEGMEVFAGNELCIQKNVECAKISAGGKININGNVIRSEVISGCEDFKIKQYLENLTMYKKTIIDLINSAEQIKINKLLGKKRDGEIIKILIENKFKLFPNLSRKILNYNVCEGIQEARITKFIIDRLLGIGPLKINKVKELSDFLEIIEDEIDEIKDIMVTQTDIYLGYCQGSIIEASGSVVLTGRGQYNSNITALKNIEFLVEQSVCRGGVLCAGSEIKLKTVGSVAGVGTKLQVPIDGRIKADIAYNNTRFCFGERQMILDVSSKNVEAYVNNNGEIIIDKFIL